MLYFFADFRTNHRLKYFLPYNVGTCSTDITDIEDMHSVSHSVARSLHHVSRISYAGSRAPSSTSRSGRPGNIRLGRTHLTSPAFLHVQFYILLTLPTLRVYAFILRSLGITTSALLCPTDTFLHRQLPTVTIWPQFLKPPHLH